MQFVGLERSCIYCACAVTSNAEGADAVESTAKTKHTLNYFWFATCSAHLRWLICLIGKWCSFSRPACRLDAWPPCPWCPSSRVPMNYHHRLISIFLWSSAPLPIRPSPSPLGLRIGLRVTVVRMQEMQGRISHSQL